MVELERTATYIQEHLKIQKRAITEWFANFEFQLANEPKITLLHYDRIYKDNCYVERYLPIEKSKK